MHRGNVPGQYNGNRLPANMDYFPGYGMSGSGQSQVRAPTMQGHNPQQYQNPYGGATSQMQYQTSQGTVYSNDPYGHSQGKAQSDMQHSLTGLNSSFGPGSDMYAGAQARPSSFASGSSGDVSLGPESNIQMQQFQQGKSLPPSWNKPSSDGNTLLYGPPGHQNASTMYNGSQFRSGLTSMQGGSRQNDPSMMRLSGQSSSFMGNEGSVRHPRSIPSYQQQISTLPSQYQQGPVSGTSSQPSLYMQQHYMNHPRSSSYPSHQPQMSTGLQQGAKVAEQFDDGSVLMQQQSVLQQQQVAMKHGQGYHLKVSSANTGAGPLNQAAQQQQQQQMVSGAVNPMQQALSPHHTSPLSPPVRGGQRTNVVPPASPQLQTSRTTPQYPAPQVSPHIHQAGSMSPSSRMPSFSPKQQITPNFVNQSQITPGYKSSTPTRVPGPRNDASARGFMSPPRMMSPPPTAMQASSMPPNQSGSSRMSMPFNSDEAAMQHYYSQQGTIPNSWQGVRQQTPNQTHPSAGSANMQVRNQIPRPTHYGMQPQQLQQPVSKSPSRFGQSIQHSNQTGFQQISNVSSGLLNSQQSTGMFSNAPTSSLTDFDQDFNLDSLLGDPVEGAGSFMQQLQEVVTSSSSNLLAPPASTLLAPQIPSFSEPTQVLNTASSITTDSSVVNVTSQQDISVTTSTAAPSVSFLDEVVPPKTSENDTNIGESSVPSISFNANEEERFDSGEITLESTEQDLLKAASSLPISFAEANLPTSVGFVASELKEQPQDSLATASTSPCTTTATSVESVPSPTMPPAPVPSTDNSMPISAAPSVTTSPASLEPPSTIAPIQSTDRADVPASNSYVTTSAPSAAPDAMVRVTAVVQPMPSTVSTSAIAPTATGSALPGTTASIPTPIPVPAGQPRYPLQGVELARPQSLGESGAYQMRPAIMNAPSMGPKPGIPPGPRMHPQDGSVVRSQGGPHYPPMHPRFQQAPRPYGPIGPYGPHPQGHPGPYPSSTAHPGRMPYHQARPGMPRGPHPEYMGGPRPHPMHSAQQQHLQQQLQGLKTESQQLQHQLQLAQQEEMDGRSEGNAPPDQPRRSEHIRRRLVEIDHNIKQIVMQLHNSSLHGPPPSQQPMQDPTMPLRHPGPIYQDGDPTASSDDASRKKRPRKPKSKPRKSDDDDVKKPPKKKKKKDTEGDAPGSEKKKKKKLKKSAEETTTPPELLGTEKLEEVNTESSQESLQVSVATDDPDAIIDDNSLVMSDSVFPVKQEKPKAKKKKPIATVVKPKKKRNRGYDSSDEMNSLDILHGTPPPSPEDSLVEKRRSGRNVKRKRYVEAVDLSFSGDDDDDGEFEPHQKKKSIRIVEMNEMTEADDVMIVDKILSHRKRVKRVKRKSVDEHPKSAPEDEDVDSDPAVDVDGSSEAPADSSKQAEVQTSQSGPILSPTSLKNPRIRKFSMGVENEDEEEEEVKTDDAEDEYYVKYKNYSYLHCDWKTKDEIEDKRFDQKLKRYLAKNTSKDGQLFYPELEADELFNPDFVEVDRVLDVTHNDAEDGKTARLFLVKWCSLPYEDSTWEQEEDINKVKIDEFESRCRYRPPRRISRPPKEAWKRLTEDSVSFCNGNVLRDYQFEGINWLLFNWYNRRNCILADEMGLGKTIQSITFLQKIFDYGIKGPFLVVAPLSTIANWEREFASWTTINAVVYHGSQTSRDMIHTYEWFCRDENLDELHGSYKMHACITTYEMVVLDSPHLRNVDWKCLIIDEAHRLKNLSCKLVESLRSMQLEHKVLLTGTPLQNNIEELYALLSFLQPDTFTCQQTFSLEFGNLKDNAQVEKLQELLKPMMLRRLKEDVEKSLAPKQETIIEVELTNIQKKYYRAILERNFEFLSKGTSGGNVPNLMNTMMELRKCCNHPYLIKGAEDKIMQEQKELHEEFNSLQSMIQSSGKLVLIDKLLPRLKQGGHKVLVFSQMVRVLDILEDYLVQRGYLYERIDGCIRGNERQMAIDRFSKKGSDRFVFLLCTRAGGLGINLTAADTVIIFDSDWNPQNDLQAQARCHRIGQQKPVKVYRLITRNSYEREMFDKASLKLGLDKAVLQSISGRQDQVASQAPQLSKREVEDLLKRGAYGAIMDDEDAANKFCEEDIDQILDRRAHTVTLESGEKGSTFSKASFVSGEDRADIALDDPNFWEKWAKKADLDVNRLKDNKLILASTRNRKQTRRFGGNSDDQEIFAEIGSDSDDSAEYDSDGNEGRKGKFRSRAGGPGGGQRKGWSRRDCFRIEKCLLTFGWGRWTTFQQRGRFGGMVSVIELEEMARTVIMYCLKYYNGDDKIKFFIWDLITPAEHAKQAGIDLKNHEGLTAPVPRGRKGRRNKDDPDKVEDEQMKREWAREMNLDVHLPDEGFKKHIQHQCNKILLRIRMLYYLRTEILNNVISAIDEGTKHDKVQFEMVDKLNDPPSRWWDSTCDKCLLLGVYKHGYEKYNLMRADNLLCFLERVGPPDDRALAAEMDVEPDGDADGDPEYKPARVTFDVDIGESPTPDTPNTEPSSPASTDASVKKKEEEEPKEEEQSEPPAKKKEEESSVKEWPSVSELNTRLRRIVTVYQKHYKQMQQRLMNMHRRSGRGKLGDGLSGVDARRPLQQARWTRREEADFYRTVSTFGIERDPRTRAITWWKFRNIARLEKKTDEHLRAYYLAFRRMCEQICQWKGEPGTSDGTGVGCNEEVPNIVVEPITEERASRTLYRIRLLDKVRCDVLPHPKLKERLNMCQRSPELPIWWNVGKHDYELLVGIDRHGLTRTELYLLSDKDFSFVEAMKEYDSNPVAFRKKLLEQEKSNFREARKALEREVKNASKAADHKVDDVPMKAEEETKPVEESVEGSGEEPGKEKSGEEEKEEIKPSPSEPDDVKTENVIENATVEEESLTEVKKEDVPSEVKSDADAEGSANKEQDLDEEEKSVDPPPVKDVKAETAKEKEENDVKVEEDAKEEAVKEADAKEDAVKEEDAKEHATKQEDAKEEEKSAVDLSSKSKGEKEKAQSDEAEKKSLDTDQKNADSAASAMALRSKTIPLPPAEYATAPPTTSPFLINSLSSRWPKDRILMLRVEQVCFCILNGEWPKSCQSLLPSMSNASDPTGSFSTGRSQSSTPQSEDRSTPVPTSLSAILPNSGDVNLMTANEKQLQAAMAQLLASSDAASRPSTFSSRRGRKKRRMEPHIVTSTGNPLQFSNQAVSPLDKDWQRKIEQLMAGSVVTPQASTSGTLFTPQPSRSESTSTKTSVKSSSSNKAEDGAGNSSASLLANLRELATADMKVEQSTPSRSRSRTSGFSRRHSPSPSRSRVKEPAPKSNPDTSSKSQQQQQQFLPSPEQLLAMNAPLQQVMQDAIKAGIDPMTAMTTFLPFFPWLDPFQGVNTSKPEASFPQIASQPSPSPADMEKILKSMGLPPELALIPGFFPGSPMSSAPPFKPESSQKEGKSREPRTETSKSNEPFTLVPTSSEKSRSSSTPDRSNVTPAKKKGFSKLDTMFGIGKADDGSPSRSSTSSVKKSRKSKFVSPAMLPPDTRIPVHNNSEGIRLSGDDAPLNNELADWLKDNSGFVVDYQALRQQLDETPTKKPDNSVDASELIGKVSTPSKSGSDTSGGTKPKDILDKAEALIRNAEKLVEQKKPSSSKSDPLGAEEKHPKRELPPHKSHLAPSPAPSRASSSATPTSSSFKMQQQQQQQQLSELALLQQMNALADPATTAALFGMPPELLTPDVLALLASGLLPGPGGLPPDLSALQGFKPGKGFDEKLMAESSRSPSRSSTPSRASPHARQSKNPPSDSNQLTGDERIPVVNITTGKKLTGKQAPELRSLADYLKSSPDYFVSAEWSYVIMKSKFLPKELHTRLLPGRSSSPPKSSSSQQTSSASNSAAMAGSLHGFPPGAMFPGMMQGQGMMDPVQLMAALQQMPGQGQMDMKALAAGGFPLFPFFGGMPNPLLGGGFPGQDPTAAAAMAALVQSASPPKKERSSRHESSSSSDMGKSRKSKRHNDKSSERSSGNRSSSSSSSFKPANQLSLPGDPMTEALAALHRSGGLGNMPNPFLAGAGNNSFLFPPVMMAGQNNMIPMEMMNPELLAAQMAAFGGLPTMEPPKSSATPSGSQKREKRRGSSSSSTSQKHTTSVARSQSRGGAEDQPMDLTSVSTSSSSDRKSPDKHKH